MATRKNAPAVALLAAFTLTLAGCATATKPMHSMPSAISHDQIRPIATWAGTPVVVEDGRPGRLLQVAWMHTGLTWDDYSTAVVQETERALLDALGPARASAPADLRVIILEHAVRFDAPYWIGNTVFEVQISRAGHVQRWTARGQQRKWNANGWGTANTANQQAYEAAVQDLLRQLALTRPAE
jgi:hypothetical protein